MVERKSLRPDSLLRNERGAVFAEYAVVMVAVTLVTAIAIGALSIPLFNLYSFAEILIGLPVP